jgi:hypothetical protein
MVPSLGFQRFCHGYRETSGIAKKKVGNTQLCYIQSDFCYFLFSFSQNSVNLFKKKKTNLNSSMFHSSSKARPVYIYDWTLKLQILKDGEYSTNKKASLKTLAQDRGIL